MSCPALRVAAEKILKLHTEENTLFQMKPRRCDLEPKATDFRQSHTHFYLKYWDVHNNLMFPSVQREGKSEGMLPVPEKRKGVNFEEHEGTIAINAEPGAFMKSRKHGGLVSSEAYPMVEQQIWRKVRGIRSSFARMPVAVVVYSEGRCGEGVSGGLHEIHSMSRKYMASNRSLGDARLFHRLVTPCKSKAVGNESATEQEVTRESPDCVKTELRIPIGPSFIRLSDAE